jgi:hypothetical protein
MADAQIIAYVKAYREHQQRDRQAAELVERIGELARRFKGWKDASGRPTIELSDWPTPAAVKDVVTALGAALQALQSCWSRLDETERSALQRPPA